MESTKKIMAPKNGKLFQNEDSPKKEDKPKKEEDPKNENDPKDDP